MPRPTDMPTSYALPESTQGTNDAPSTTARDQYVDMENGGNGMRKRTKAGVETTSKSNHQLQKPILSSSTSIASRSPATSPPISLKASKDATMDSRNQGQSGHTTESEEEAEKDDIDDDNNGDDGDSDEDNHDSEEGENNDDDNDDNDGEDEDTIGDDTKDKLKDNEATSGTFGLKSTSTRTSNVPVQSDANFNREGYVRMTRVPRLGPSAETISDYMSNILFQPKNARPKDSYYAVLRYDTLFLYESDQQRDCKFVMQMTLHEVKIFPRNLPDNEVFNKEHPIQIKRRASAPASSSVPANSQDEYYIFIHTPVIKEDW
ncbi:hypothetical protein BGX31_010611 [Mortierella sp. GBA43]|nr:hypothetical protein BGX31_010611 [Mortierella sp. GBA43]